MSGSGSWLVENYLKFYYNRFDKFSEPHCQLFLRYLEILKLFRKLINEKLQKPGNYFVVRFVVKPYSRFHSFVI